MVAGGEQPRVLYLPQPTDGPARGRRVHHLVAGQCLSGELRREALGSQPQRDLAARQTFLGLEQTAHPVALEAGDPAAELALRSPDLAGPLGHGHIGEQRWADQLVVHLLGPLKPRLQFGLLLGRLDPLPHNLPPPSGDALRVLPLQLTLRRSSPRASVATTPAEAPEHATRWCSRPISRREGYGYV